MRTKAIVITALAAVFVAGIVMWANDVILVWLNLLLPVVFFVATRERTKENLPVTPDRQERLLKGVFGFEGGVGGLGLGVVLVLGWGPP